MVWLVGVFVSSRMQDHTSARREEKTLNRDLRVIAQRGYLQCMFKSRLFNDLVLFRRSGYTKPYVTN